MKKLSCIVLIFVLLSLSPVSGKAAEKDVIHFEDGSYMTIEIITDGTKASGTVTGSKKSTYYGSDGGSEWVAVLTGRYTYTGSDASCISSDLNVNIQDSDWYVVTQSATKSGNTAYGSATMGLRVTGVTIRTVPVSLTLSCDGNGNLS